MSDPSPDILSGLDPATRKQAEQLFWAEEFETCAHDLAYLATQYLKVKGKEQIKLFPLTWRRCQQYVHDRAMRQLKEKGWIRLIIEKARQTGISTWATAFCYQQTAFRDHRNALLVGSDDDVRKTVFGKAKVFHDHMVPALKQVLKYNTAEKLHFTRTDSVYRASHARNLNVGAGDMVHVLHQTENARYEKPDEVESSLNPAIADAKGTDFSVIIKESTAVVGGEWFQQEWEAAHRGETNFEAIFLPWFWHETYRVASLPPGFRLDAEEREMKKRFKLDDEQLAWRRATIATDYQANPTLFDQDYPCTHEEAWVLPKGSARIFDEDDILKAGAWLRPGDPHEPTAAGLIEKVGGPVDIWQHPEPGRFYHLGIDVAGSDEPSADWTSGVVVRRDTLEQVAGFRMRIDPADERLFQLVYWLGKAYNTAQLVPDITGGWGHNLLTELKKSHYPHFWLMRNRADAKGRITTRQGFRFSKETKRVLVTTATAAVKQHACRIFSENLISEMRSYLNVAPDEWRARKGCYDDELTAWMLALMAAIDHQTPASAPKEKPPRKPEPWETFDIDKALKQPTGRKHLTDRWAI